MSKELVPAHIKTLSELQEFPDSNLDWDKPWEYRVSGGCAGLIVRPILIILGQGKWLKQLEKGEIEELKELLFIANSSDQWNQLDPLQQLDLRKRASILSDRFSINKITSFKK